MTPLMLEELLIKRIKTLLKKIKSVDRNNNLVPIKVIQGVPIPKRAGSAETKKFNVPFVSIRFLKGTDRRGKYSKALVVIDVMLCNNTQEKHQELLNILEKIRQNLFKTPILDNKFELDFNSDHTIWIVEEDIFPYIEGVIETTWNYYRVSSEQDLKML